MYLRAIGLSVVVVLCFFAACSAAVPMADFGGFKDPDLFTRMPNYYLLAKNSFVERPFDKYEFPVTKTGKSVRERVEGHYTFYLYRFDESKGSIPSPLQIVRNYQAAAARIGGKTMNDDSRGTTLLVAKNGREFWARVEPYYGGKEYHLTIIDKQVMEQEVKANADAFKAGLAQTGHVEVPGIFLISINQT
jgi:hypothetical protein